MNRTQLVGVRAFAEMQIRRAVAMLPVDDDRGDGLVSWLLVIAGVIVIAGIVIAAVTTAMQSKANSINLG